MSNENVNEDNLNDDKKTVFAIPKRNLFSSAILQYFGARVYEEIRVPQIVKDVNQVKLDPIEEIYYITHHAPMALKESGLKWTKKGVIDVSKKSKKKKKPKANK